MLLGQSWKTMSCLLVCTALFHQTLIQENVLAAEEDATEASTEDSSKATAGDNLSQDDKDRIAKLIRQLDDDSFDNREDAGTMLQRIGSSAVPALVEAATNGSLEAKVRAKRILGHLLDSPEEATLSALRKIADGEANANATTAKDLLKTEKKAQSGEVPPNQVVIPGEGIRIFGGGGPIRIGGGGPIRIVGGEGIQIRAIAGGGGFSRSVVKNGDNTVIKVSEGGKKVEIAIDGDGHIKMKITEKKEGKPVERAYEFDSEKEFQEKNPEVFKEFEKYKEGKLGGGIIKLNIEHHEKIQAEMRKRIEEMRRRHLPPALQKKIEVQ